MRFRFAAALLLLSAACGKEGETFTVRTRLLSPAGVTDPVAGLDRVRIRVIQDGDVRGEREFDPDDVWKIPSGADPSRSLVLRIDGLDATGNVIRTGGTRSLVPDDSKGRVFGIFFSAPGEFASPPASPVLREGAETLPLPDGRVVTVGGDDGLGNSVDAVSVYDPDAGEWRELAPLSEARSAPGVAVLPDGLTLLVAGGGNSLGEDLGSTEIYRVPAPGADADTGDTTAGPALVTPWSAMQLAPLASGTIVLAGGYANNGSPLPAIFDPVSGSLYEIAGGTFASSASVTSTGDGRVAIVGGATPETASRVDVVSEDSNGAVLLTSGVGALRVPREAPSAISIDAGRIVVTGGQAPSGGLTSAVEVVDLTGATTTSSLVERERVRRSTRAVERLGDGRILLAGGADTVGNASSRAFVFDPATNRVDEVGSLPEPLAGRRYGAPLPDGTAMFVGGDASSDVRIFQPPVDPIDAGDRVTLAVSLVEGSRANGAVLDGADEMRVRFFDDASEVLEVAVPPGTTASVPGFVPDDAVHVLVEALAGGEVIAWGATSAPIDDVAQASGALTLLMGRVGEFVLAPQTLPNPHRDGVGVQLDDGRVAIACGAAGADKTDVFDPGSGAAAELLTAVVPTARSDSRVAVVGGSLFLVGGLNGAGNPSTASSLFDPGTGLWSAASALPAPGRAKHVVVSLGDGTVLSHGNNANVVGVTPGDVWNGTNWQSILVPRKRSHHQGVLLGNGDVLLVAGLNTSGPGTPVISATAETFDPGNQVFTPTAGAMATARRDHIAFGIPGGDAVVCGGLVAPNTSAPLSSCERYNMVARTFSGAGTLSVARDDSAAATFPDGSTWIVGGGTGTTGTSTSAVDVWSGGAIGPGPSMRSLRASPTLVVLRDGRLVAAGGFDAAAAVGELSSIEIHTPPAWTNPFGY